MWNILLCYISMINSLVSMVVYCLTDAARLRRPWSSPPPRQLYEHKNKKQQAMAQNLNSNISANWERSNENTNQTGQERTSQPVNPANPANPANIFHFSFLLLFYILFCFIENMASVPSQIRWCFFRSS